MSDYLNSLEEGNILVGDWGIATQLVLFSNTPQNITEVSFQFNWQDISSVTQESFDLVQNCNYIVLHSEENVIFKNANKNLRSLNLGSLIYTDSVFEVFECKN